MLKQFRHLSERGDTIVEVLISIAIVSLILGGAFVATNRSFTATRDAQERSDGLKLVESQLEQLKSIVAAGSVNVFGSTPASYCIASGALVDSSNNLCKVNAAGVYSTTQQPRYNMAITRDGNVFTVTNNWDGVTGRPANVQMKYRLYQ